MNNAIQTTTDAQVYGFAGASPGFKINNISQAINSLTGTSAVGQLSLDNGTLTITGNGSTTWAGIVTGQANTTTGQGQLVKQGAGTLTFSNLYVGAGASTFWKLIVSNGTVALAGGNFYPQSGVAAASQVFTADAVTIENGSKLQWNGVTTMDTSLGCRTSCPKARA